MHSHVGPETDDPAHVAHEEVRRFLQLSGIGITMLSHMEASEVVRAFERYGKGRHAAGLNMGVRFSYAGAKLRGVELLLKGNDFARTDLA